MVTLNTCNSKCAVSILKQLRSPGHVIYELLVAMNTNLHRHTMGRKRRRSVKCRLENIEIGVQQNDQM